MKKNVPVVVGEFQQEVAEVFEGKARETNSKPGNIILILIFIFYPLSLDISS